MEESPAGQVAALWDGLVIQCAGYLGGGWLLYAWGALEICTEFLSSIKTSCYTLKLVLFIFVCINKSERKTY